MMRREKFVFRYNEEEIRIFVGLKPADSDSADNQPVGIRDELYESPNIFEYNMADSVVHSVTDVFDMILTMDVVPFVSNNGTGLSANRIVGSISLSGKVMGRVNLHIPEAFHAKWLPFMFGIQPKDMEGLDEAKDVVGELCNMISGA